MTTRESLLTRTTGRIIDNFHNDLHYFSDLNDFPDLGIHHHHGPGEYDLIIHKHDQYGVLDHHIHSVGTANNRPLSINYEDEHHDHERETL